MPVGPGQQVAVAQVGLQVGEQRMDPGQGDHLRQPVRRSVGGELRVESAGRIGVVTGVAADHARGVETFQETGVTPQVAQPLVLAVARPTAANPVVGKRLAIGDLESAGVQHHQEHVLIARETGVEVPVVAFAAGQVGDGLHPLVAVGPIAPAWPAVAMGAAGGWIVDVQQSVRRRLANRLGDDHLLLGFARGDVVEPGLIALGLENGRILLPGLSARIRAHSGRIRRR